MSVHSPVPGSLVGLSGLRRPTTRPPVWLWALCLSAVFAGGVGVGYGVAVFRFDPLTMMPPPGPRELQAKIVERLAAEVGLTAEQRPRVEAIVASHVEKLESLREEFHPRIMSEFDAMDAELSTLLTPEQRALWEKTSKLARERLGPPPHGTHKHGAGGRDGAAPHGRPGEPGSAGAAGGPGAHGGPGAAEGPADRGPPDGRRPPEGREGPRGPRDGAGDFGPPERGPGDREGAGDFDRPRGPRGPGDREGFDGPPPRDGRERPMGEGAEGRRPPPSADGEGVMEGLRNFFDPEGRGPGGRGPRRGPPGPGGPRDGERRGPPPGENGPPFGEGPPDGPPPAAE